MELANTISRRERIGMVDERLQQAIDAAWSVYRATHMLTRRMNGDACLSDICKIGGRQESMMTWSGLAYLERFPSKAELENCLSG